MVTTNPSNDRYELDLKRRQVVRVYNYLLMIKNLLIWDVYQLYNVDRILYHTGLMFTPINGMIVFSFTQPFKNHVHLKMGEQYKAYAGPKWGIER